MPGAWRRIPAGREVTTVGMGRGPKILHSTLGWAAHFWSASPPPTPIRRWRGRRGIRAHAVHLRAEVDARRQVVLDDGICELTD